MDEATKRDYIQVRLTKAAEDLDADPSRTEDVQQIVAEAERFVDRMERYLREVGAMA